MERRVSKHSHLGYVSKYSHLNPCPSGVWADPLTRCGNNRYTNPRSVFRPRRRSSGVPLARLAGHHEARLRLARAFRAGRLPHALLLTGPEGIGTQGLALWLAQPVL